MKTINEIRNLFIEIRRLLNAHLKGHIDKRADPIFVKNSAFYRIAGMFVPGSEESRVIQQFLESRCEKRADYQIQPAYVYFAYIKWRSANGHGYITQDELDAGLIFLGNTRKYVDGRSYWVGITLKPE